MAELAAQGVLYSQNRAILSAVETLEHLQIANLATGVVGIGVSIAGTSLLFNKIKCVETKVDKVLGELHEVSRKLDALRFDRIVEDFTRLRTASAQFEEGWLLTDPEPEWRSVARETHALADAFARRASETLSDGMGNPLAAEPFVEAFALASTIRTAARLAGGDEQAARDVAQSTAQTAAEFGQALKLGDLVLRRMKDRDDAGSVGWNFALDEIATELRPTIDGIREREWALASSVLTIDELINQGIGGRAWLSAARSEEEKPLLFLPSSGGGLDRF